MAEHKEGRGGVRGKDRGYFGSWEKGVRGGNKAIGVGLKL